MDLQQAKDLLEKACSLLQQGKYKEAVECCESIPKDLNDEYIAANMIRGQGYIQLQQKESAIKVWKEILKLQKIL